MSNTLNPPQGSSKLHYEPSSPRQLSSGITREHYHALKPLAVLQPAATFGLAVVLLCALYSSFITASLPDFAAYSCSLLLLVALLSAIFITPKAFTPGFLVSTLLLVTAWRVAAMNSDVLVEIVAGAAFLLLLLQFMSCMINDLRENAGSTLGWFMTLLWQVTFLRLVFGINEIGHADEKIFAGVDSFHHMQSTFMGLGIDSPTLAGLMVIAAGVVEFSLAISVGLGLLTRAGALLGVIYFLIATVGFGGEWSNGYGWNTPNGGGWEYVLLILVFFGSTACVGAGKFSLDGWLIARGWMPRPLLLLCTNRAGVRSLAS